MNPNESAHAASAPIPPQPPAKGFWPLFVVQFQGAFSDNVFKFLVIFFITSTRTPAERDQLISLALAMFALPFVLFSMTGGYLADRYAKRSVIIGIKIAEVFIMSLGLIGLWLGQVNFLLAIIFLMSAQSALFGPSKYGSLPELLPESRLSWGNGWLGLGTFVAIITGGVLAGLLHQKLGDLRYLGGFLLVLLAGVGVVVSLKLPALPAANPTKPFRINFLGDLWLNLRTVRQDRVLTLAIMGCVYFWFIAALFGEPTILTYSQDVLKLNETQISLLRACLAIGIGLGSVSAGFLSGRKIEYGLVPLGAGGLALCAALLGVPGWSAGSVAAILALLGFSGGFFIVPINALIQHRPDPKDKGSVIAANAWLTSVGVFVASGAFWLLKTAFHLPAPTIFLIGAGLTLIATIYALRLVPDALLRFIMWIATHTLYRIKVLGRENIPTKGGALFVCNHLSLADATFLQAAVDRPIRFIMLKAMYDKPFIGRWAKITGAIPISSELRPREMLKSLQTASDAIKNGEVVCIFAEGQITRIGQLMPFRRGFERIMQGVDAPIIPVGLDGVWGSIFSFESHRFLWKWPRRIPYLISVNFGKPMPPTAAPFEVRQVVQELLAEAWRERKRRMRPLHHSFVVSARRRPRRLAMADALTPAVTFSGALTRSILLARRLKKVWAGQKMVGLLLPPSVGGALANWAALFCGKVPVNLNYTLSEESLAACAKQCNLKTILTSRAFIEKVKLKLPGEILYLEDVIRNSPPSVWEKLTALFIARCLPVAWVERVLNDQPAAPGNPLDQLATIIFSSGSTGEPKGVMLTHYNVGSNIEQLGQTFAFGGRDKILGVLPFFHSFGFTGTLMLPGVLGIGAVYHVNPLDAKTIGQLVGDHEVTFLLATPTFLQIYMRGCTAEQFGSVRLVAVGAEKLPERLATAFEEQFGIRPFEAYGCTECAPAVTVNTHDFRAAGFRQVGAKRGKIGHPLPGVCVRIVDPVSANPAAPLPLGQSGLLLVRGPNVMLGYLGKPEKTAEVLRDGWYTTGDIAALDEDGFIQITDRLSRFSKIGGEMVPHIKVEELLHELAGVTEHTFVVTSIADERKGERLVVLHKLAADKLQPCLDKLSASDLPNLWKPKADSFVRMEAFPMLGTGKLDLRKVKEVAQRSSGPSGPG
jgi:acyl-[acyl-carrier-protein]-phospholipid O-acyltransferase/long-chain-fatty-acid--[acyl-carrier-protein] ligase